MNMVYFMGTYSKEVTWIPPIEKWTIEEGTTLEKNDDGVVLKIPYSIETAYYLFGHMDIEGTVYAYNGSEIGTALTSVQLGSLYDGIFYIYTNDSSMKGLLTKTQTLTIDTNMKFGGLELRKNFEYVWGAPLNNLKIDYSLENGSLIVTYGYENDYEDMCTSVKITVLSGGTVLNEKNIIDNVSKGEQVEEHTSFSNLTSTPDTIEFEVSTGDFTYTEVYRIE